MRTMPIASVADFLRLIDEYALVDAAQRPHLSQLAQTGPSEPRAFAREVLERGWLTAYQINQVFLDNAASLVLGSYVILERLGTGGMGSVFKARNQKLGRIVALKVIHPHKLDNPAAVKRFRREIHVAAHLQHPNIVHAIDAEVVNGAELLVMEYIEGTNLTRLVKDHGPLPVTLACEYVRQAALALQHAHEKGLVHRDVKPSNLMLQTGGTIKLLDLGLALLHGPLVDGSVSGPLTVAGKVIGTVDFLAPEQARDASSVDIRADLYSLGCTFYYLLTGQPPFAGATTTNKIYKHALEEPEPVRRLRPDVSQPVSAVIRRLLAKRPEDRFQTPAELAAVLQDLLHRRASPAVPAVRDRVVRHFPADRQSVPVAIPAQAAAEMGSEPIVRASPRPTRLRDRRRWRPLAAAVLAVLILVGLALAVWHFAASAPQDSGKPEARPTRWKSR
jgi:serine/threonine protein kinase